jgi:hypothetical protein
VAGRLRLLEESADQPGCHPAELEGSADVQERCYYGVAKAQIPLAEGDHAGALDVAESVFSERESLGVAHEPIKEAFVVGCWPRSSWTGSKRPAS